MCNKSYWIIIIASTLFVSGSYAQSSLHDSLSYTVAANKAIDYYNEAIAEQSEIYNGAAYESPAAAYKGSVYFQDKNYCTPGLVRYNGTLYKNVPVFYNSYSDIMVVASRNLFNYILGPGKVSDVYLLNHHFIYINAENAGNLDAGFYDQLYDGKSAVLVKRTKTISNNITSQTVEVTYKDQSDIYLKKGDKYYPVNGKSAVMAIFQAKKKELNQYLKSNNIKYNRDRESSVVSLARYYDQITN
jgi:hypothetical protein